MQPQLSDSEKGFLVLWLLVIIAVAGGFSVMLMQSTQDGTDLQRSLREQQVIANTQYNVLALLRNRAICEANFKDHSVAASATDTVTRILSDGGSAPTTFLEEGQVLDEKVVRMRDLRLSNFKPYGTVAPDTLRGTIELQMAFGATNSTSLPRQRTILLAVDLNPYPPAVAGPANEIKTCVAIGADSDFWKQLPSGDIMYLGGNVGVGQTNPTEKLHVAGNMMAKDYYHPSDEALKTEVRPSVGLAVLTELRGVQFNWTNSDLGAYGVLAQNVERVFPEAVPPGDEGQFKRVDYDQLLAPLVESVKELEQKNRALKVRLARLRGDAEPLTQ